MCLTGQACPQDGRHRVQFLGSRAMEKAGCQTKTASTEHASYRAMLILLQY